jgi:hypothetical protein
VFLNGRIFTATLTASAARLRMPCRTTSCIAS